ncbi:expressed unknown protein [Seminavis robusta]|uniref:Uncharacterized protein n=1 Tax=Seminavis robusta TaxID=568900 RepID=A0A9N8HFA3_9STRA|nr:expressed unknown protein [Seminavis robusta]|eukprot:Sro426_g140330.1 n/a (338) ;mRNA; f:14135-15248
MQASLTTLALLSVVAVQPAFGQHGCYIDGTEMYIGYIPVDVELQCCRDTGELYGYREGLLHQKTSSELRDSLEECAASIEEDMMWNLDHHCNSDYTSCNIDYHSFTCDDDVMKLCRRKGGKVVEGDMVFRCSSYGQTSRLKFLNKVDCIAASCDEEELYTMFEAAGSAIGCEVSSIGDVKVDGKTTSFSWSASGSSGSSGKIWGILGAAFAVLAVGAIIWKIHSEKVEAKTREAKKPGDLELPEVSATAGSAESADALVKSSQVPVSMKAAAESDCLEKVLIKKYRMTWVDARNVLSRAKAALGGSVDRNVLLEAAYQIYQNDKAISKCSDGTVIQA